MQPTVPFIRPEANLGLAHPYTVELIDGEEREKVAPRYLHSTIQEFHIQDGIDAHREPIRNVWDE